MTAAFIEIPSNPTPNGAELFIHEARDGVKLRCAFFPTENARGAIILQAGWSEFIEKYFETVRDLQAHGYSVAMMDWRAQGLSDRENDATRDWPDYFQIIRDDLREFTEVTAARFPGRLFLMTHSMAGMPALMLLATGYDRFEKAVLCAPMTRLFAPAMNGLVRVAAFLTCHAGMARTAVNSGSDDSMRFEGNMFSTDRTRHTMFKDLQQAEPRAALSAPTYGWVREALAASREIHRTGYFDDVKTPVLIVTAGDEQRIDATDHPEIANRHELISQTTIPGALHEIMMERDELRDQFLQTTLNFFQENAQTRAS
ncbi:MAG: alpha/beta hydrolase [Marinicaulis sp.]|nr:alpha/beta hydrolase [Marinicaulis sp.]